MYIHAHAFVNLPSDWILSITLIEVETDSGVTRSVQLTELPLRPSLTGLISSLDISGRLSSLDTREKINDIVEFTSRYDV